MQKPSHPRYIVESARRLRRSQTAAEKVLWGCLRNRGIMGAKFRRQYPIGRYIADFYCHEAHLAIELQGSIHEKEDQKEYDAIRQETIEQQGIRLLCFRNDEVVQDLSSVLKKIAEALGK